jgi:hypothetical protein
MVPVKNLLFLMNCEYHWIKKSNFKMAQNKASGLKRRIIGLKERIS